MTFISTYTTVRTKMCFTFMDINLHVQSVRWLPVKRKISVPNQENMRRVIFKSCPDLKSRKTARKYDRWTDEAEGKEGNQVKKPSEKLLVDQCSPPSMHFYFYCTLILGSSVQNLVMVDQLQIKQSYIVYSCRCLSGSRMTSNKTCLVLIQQKKKIKM